jgi:hypothetical protein
MYNVTLWYFLVTNIAVARQQCILCVVELLVTANYVKVLGVVQECFCGLRSLARINTEVIM